MHYRKHRLLVPFLAPALILYGVFVLWPYTQALYVAFTGWRGMSPNKPFVGLANFRKLAADDVFWNALGHNALMLLGLPVTVLSIALVLAALTLQGIRAGGSAYRVVFFFPQVMSAVVIGVLWNFVFHPNIGLLNGALGSLGLGGLKRTWLGDPGLVLWAIFAVAVWAGVGFFVVYFVAGMQSIPGDLYEAARLDGANPWQAFWGITLPLLRDHLQVALIFVGLGALDLFVLVQVMAEGGGPSRAADVVARYMVDVAFGQSQFGYATAIGVVLLVLSLTLSFAMFRLTRRERLEF